MKREEVEVKVKEGVDFTRQKLSVPVPAFFAGLVLGFLLGGYPKLVLTILALTALAVGAIWFFADKANRKKPETVATSGTVPPVNSSASNGAKAETQSESKVVHSSVQKNVVPQGVSQQRVQIKQQENSQSKSSQAKPQPARVVTREPGHVNGK